MAQHVVYWGPGEPPPGSVSTDEPGAAVAIAGSSSTGFCAIGAADGRVVCWGGRLAGVPAFGGHPGPATGVAVGGAACAIVEDAVACWGNDALGQASPPPAVDGTQGGARAVAMSNQHGCAIDLEGAVICWGYYAGEVEIPPEVDGTAGTARSISAGNLTMCAIQASNDGVVCWGPRAAGVPPSVDGSEGGAASVSVGNDWICAVQASNGLPVCWGNREDAYVPDSVGAVSEIQVGYAGACAIRSQDGDLRCWGGLGSARYPGVDQGPFRHIAVGSNSACGIQIDSGAVQCWGELEGAPGDVDGLTGRAVALDVSRQQHCAIESETSGVVCWGYSGPAPPSLDGSLGGASAISIGEHAFCAIEEDSSDLNCWNDRFAPVEKVRAVSSGFYHGCAIDLDGAVFCWGDEDVTPPASVDGTEGRAFAIGSAGAYLSDLRQEYYSCAIQDPTDAVVCWGQAERGQLEPPPGLGPVVGLGVGSGSVCAVQMLTGAVRCWGETCEPPPPEVDGTLGGAREIAVGPLHACAIQSGSGRVYCWGCETEHNPFTPPDYIDGVSYEATALSVHAATYAIIQPVPAPGAAALASMALSTLGGLVCWRRRRAPRCARR